MAFRARRHRLIVSGVMVALPVLTTLIMLLIASAPAQPAPAALHGQPHSNAAAHFLLALALMLGLAFAAGKAAMLAGQPAVVGELLVGVLLGPSALGAVAPQVSGWLFAPHTTAMVHGLSELGLVVFMAGVGVEFAGSAHRGRSGDSLVAAASLLVPFAAGAVLATALAGRYLGPAQSRPAFVLFLGCVLGVTAFPVLARLIADAGLSGSRVAQLSMYSAAMGDGIVWVLLLVVGAYAGAGLGAVELWPPLVVVVVVAVALIRCRRGDRTVRTAGAGRAEPPGRRLAPVVVAIAVAAAATAFGGVHEVVGAFLAGVLLSQLAGGYRGAIQHVLTVARYVLFPLFLVEFGMAVDFTVLSMTSGPLLLTGIIVLIGSVAKMTGAGFTARLNGMRWRDSLAVGTLANARGMTELVVLQIGAEMGIVNAPMFAMLTCATMLMTMLVAPLVQLLRVQGDPPHSEAAHPEALQGELRGVAADQPQLAGG